MSNIFQDSALQSRQYTLFVPGNLNDSRALIFSINLSPTSAITEMCVVLPTSECDLLSVIIPSFLLVRNDWFSSSTRISLNFSPILILCRWYLHAQYISVTALGSFLFQACQQIRSSILRLHFHALLYDPVPESSSFYISCMPIKFSGFRPLSYLFLEFG